MSKAGSIKKHLVLGIKAKFSRIDTEEFIVDRKNHLWIYQISTGLKLHNCKIELPSGAEDITATSIEHEINLQPKTNPFVLRRQDVPHLSFFELVVSFVTRPRMDEVISYVREASAIGNGNQRFKIITVQSKQNCNVNRIRLERVLDFEPRVFKIEEMSLGGDVEITSALIEISKDNIGRTAKSTLSWETDFLPLQTKHFRLSYELPREEEKIATQITKLVIQCNLLFKQVTSVEEIFRDTMSVADELHTQCISERDFPHKIGVLCQLFDVKLEPLRNLLKSFDKDWGTIKLVEEWLKQARISYDPLIIQTWKNIIELRNKSPPFHRPDSRIVELCKFFEQDYPPEYPELWRSIVSKFKESLQNFLKTLAEIAKT